MAGVKTVLWSLVLSAAGGIAASAAIADDSPPLTIDETVVERCLSDTPPTEQPTCVGDASNACQESCYGGTSLGIAECLAAERKVWERLLARELAATREVYEEEDKASAEHEDWLDLTDGIDASQAAWAAYVNAECALQYRLYQQGSIRNAMLSVCKLHFIVERVFSLRNMREL